MPKIRVFDFLNIFQILSFHVFLMFYLLLLLQNSRPCFSIKIWIFDKIVEIESIGGKKIYRSDVYLYESLHQLPCF